VLEREPQRRRETQIQDLEEVNFFIPNAPYRFLFGCELSPFD
jgi:hypothetical protein